MHGQPDTPRHNLFSNLVFGLRVMLSELQWLGLKALRAHELRQLRKRLTEEHTAFGRALAGQLRGLEPGAPLPPLDGEALLAYKQVAFLEEELLHLDRERERLRTDFETRRKAALGLS